MINYNWTAPKFTMKATQAQKDLAEKQAAFYDVMTQDYKTKFADQKAIQESLTAAFGPIVAAGPGQFGMTREEEAAQRTGARDTTAKAYQDAARAVRGTLAARGGGDIALGSGAEAQIEASIAAQAAESAAAKQTDITRFGYDIGRTNFFNAASVLSGNAAMMSPTSYSSTAVGGGSAATSAANAVQQAGGGFMRWLGGVAGGAISSFVNPLASAGAGAILGGGTGGCWVAEAVYGKGSPIANLIWETWRDKWANESRWSRTLFGVYLVVGEPLGWLTKHSSILKSIFKPLFDRAYNNALVRKVNNNGN